VVANDLMAHGEAEADPGLPGREEGVEDRLAGLLRDPGAVVRDLDEEHLGAPLGPNDDAAGLGRGALGGIEDEVDEDLLELAGIEDHAAELTAELELKGDPEGLSLELHKRNDRVQELGNGDRGEGWLGRPRELEKFLQELVGPKHLPVGETEEFGEDFGVFLGPLHDLKGGPDSRQGIPDLMGEACGELPEGGQAGRCAGRLEARLELLKGRPELTRDQLHPLDEGPEEGPEEQKDEALEVLVEMPLVAYVGIVVALPLEQNMRQIEQ